MKKNNTRFDNDVLKVARKARKEKNNQNRLNLAIGLLSVVPNVSTKSKADRLLAIISLMLKEASK